MRVRDRRTDLHRQRPGTNGMLHQSLHFLAIDSGGKLPDREDEPRDMPRAQPSSNSVAQLAIQRLVELVPISHDDK